MNSSKIQKNLKNIILIWKKILKEPKQINKDININSDFFDNCLSLNKNNNELINNNDINTFIENKSNKDNSINNKEEKIDNNIENLNNKNSDYVDNVITNLEKSIDFDENIFPKYNDKNNDSININKDFSINENKNNNDNKTNGYIDDFDIKINEDNFKMKSDIFNSSKDIKNDSINAKSINININIDDNICNFSTGKEIETISTKENKNENENENKSNEIDKYNVINNSENEINEICNLSTKEKEKKKEKETINNIKNNDSNEKNKNTKENIFDIKLEEIKDNNDIFNQYKNILINGQEKINYNSNKSRNENINNDKVNNNDFFDSLDNISILLENKNNDTNDNIEKIKVCKTLSNIQNNKMVILSKFLTLEKNNWYKKDYNTPKKYKFLISEANKIFLNKNEHINKIDSLYSTNQTQSKVENIFIKGENPYNTEFKSTKNLEVFIIDKNDNIFINNNINKINEKKLINNFNNIMQKNIQERIIDSKMIINFLNNSKNEPMFQTKKFSTIQSSKEKREIYENNIINYEKTEENKNINFHTLKNLSHEKANHFYLKKQLTNNLNINEKELIEPNVQICPVTCNIINKKEINDIYDKLNKENIIEDLLKIKKRKNILKTKKKSHNNLSSYLSNNKTFDKYNAYEQNWNKTCKKNYSNSNDFIEFFNKAKDNKDNIKRNTGITSYIGEIYNFKTIKYDKFNTYRENIKNKNLNKGNKNKIIFNSFGKNKNHLNKINKKNNINNNHNVSFGNNKKSFVDYRRLNKLYLDYKIKNIKRNKLKKEQDIKRGITT